MAEWSGVDDRARYHVGQEAEEERDGDHDAEQDEIAAGAHHEGPVAEDHHEDHTHQPKQRTCRSPTINKFTNKK